jgi:hypothetical protein
VALSPTCDLSKTHPSGEGDDENTNGHVCSLQPSEADHAPLNDLEYDYRSPGNH